MPTNEDYLDSLLKTVLEEEQVESNSTTFEENLSDMKSEEDYQIAPEDLETISPLDTESFMDESEQDLADEEKIESTTFGDELLDEFEIDDTEAEEFGVDEIQEDEKIDFEEIDDLFEQLENLDSENLTSEETLEIDTSEEEVSEIEEYAEKDIEQLFDEMGDEEDIAEINELLKKDENKESIDEDMLSLLDNVEEIDDSDTVGVDDIDIFGMEVSEESQDEEEQDELREILELTEGELGELGTGKKKKFGKSKKNKQIENKETDEENKKKSFLTKVIEFFTEEVNADEITENENLDISDENSAILDELDHERSNVSKSSKKEKKPKKDKKPQKEKKPKKEKIKKEKKPKKESAPKEPVKKEKKIAKEKIICVVFFAVSIFVLVYVMTIFIPALTEKREAMTAFKEQNYDEVYQLLLGKKLNDKEEGVLKGATLVKAMQRKVDSYTNNMQLGDAERAVNALIEGVEKYEPFLEEASKYGVESQISSIYAEVLNILQTEYNLSEEQAKEIAATKDNLSYTMQIKNLAGGGTFSMEETEENSDQIMEEGNTEILQDMLPEEEELNLE